MGKLKELLLAVLSDRSHMIGKWRSRPSQRRQRLGPLGRVSENDTDTSRIYGSVTDQIVPTMDNSELLRQLHDSKEEMAVVDEIARIITSTLDINQVYEQFAAELKKLVDFDRITINLLDTANETYTLKYVSGSRIEGRDVGVVRPLAGTLSQHLIQSGQTVIRRNIVDPRFAADLDNIKCGLRSGMALPLASQGRIVATLSLVREQVGAYGKREQAIVERLARQIAPAVENTQLYEQCKRAEGTQRRWAEETSVMAEIGRTVNASLDINEVCESLGEEIRKLIPFDRMSLTLANYENGTMSPGWGIGTDVPGRRSGDEVPLAGGFAAGVVRARLPILFEVETEADVETSFPLMMSAYNVGLRSFMAVPLFSRDSVIGVLQVHLKKRGVYTQGHLELLERMGSQIAGAIANSQLYAERKRLAEENSVVAELGRVMSSSLDIKEVYDRFGAETRKLIPFDHMCLSLIDQENGVSSVTWVFGQDIPDRGPGDIVPLAGAFVNKVVLARSPVMLEAATEADLFSSFPRQLPAFHAGMRSFLGVPLFYRDDLIGVLQLQSKEQGIYTQRDLDLAGRVGNQIAGAIANARLYEEVKEAEAQQRLLARENQTLAEIGRIVSSSLHIEEVYAQFSQEVSKLISFDNINIVTVNHEQSNFTIRYHDGLVVPGRELGQTFPLAGSATEKVVHECEGHLWRSENRAEIEQSNPRRLPDFDSGLRSFLSAPLMFRDTVTGVLHLRSRESDAYTDLDLALAAQIGLQIAPALENARLYQETRKAEESERQRSEELHGLLKVSSILAQPGSFGSKASPVMEELARIADAESAAFRVPEAGGLRRFGSTGEQPEGTTIVPYEGNIPALVYRDKETFVVNDYPNHPLAVKHHVRRGVKSVMAAPIVSQESVVGVVIVNSLDPDHFTPERVNLVLGIINGLGSLFETARLEDERSQAEQELRESERRFRQISENMREVVFLVDHKENKVLYVNDAFEEIWGQPSDRLYDNPMFWIDAVHPDDRSSVEVALNNQLSTGEFEEEFRIIRPDGTIRWIFDRTFPIQNEAGEVYRLVGIAEDVTERKETEQRMHENARLASIGELAAGVAHELNNPLAAVLGFSELLMARRLSPSSKEDVATIHDQAQRASRVVQNLLSFARNHQPERRYVDVTAIIAGSVELKAYDLATGNIQVAFDFPGDIPHTMADEYQLQQVFLNIIVNAEQAIAEHKGTGSLGISGRKVGDYIKLSFTDDGPGIPVEHLKRIFDPFFTTKEVGKGTGLGLSICYGIIHEHGGNIWAESQVGKGTTFHIELPVLPFEARPAQQIQDIPSGRDGPSC